MNKPELKKPGLQPTLNRQEKTKISKDDAKKIIERMRARDAELVTGIFQNKEHPATSASRGCASFKFKLYPNEPFEHYELYDGERYSLPRGVVRHINTNCFYKEYKQLGPEAGFMQTAIADGKYRNHQQMQVATKVHRYAFHSMDFMEDDPEMRPADLLEVTMSP